MASDINFVEFIVEQISKAGNIRYKKMFGEYAVYCNEKVIALICNNQLFVKPTEAGKVFIGNIKEAAPYPGAKMYFLIEAQLENKEWMTSLIKITADELPVPKVKKKKIN